MGNRGNRDGTTRTDRVRHTGDGRVELHHVIDVEMPCTRSPVCWSGGNTAEAVIATRERLSRGCRPDGDLGHPERRTRKHLAIDFEIVRLESVGHHFRQGW